MSNLIKLLIIFVLFTSCNPVKRVLNNQKKFEIVAKEVVKRGYCVNDTIIIDSSRIDTVYHQNYIIDTITINKEFNIDTVLKSGAKVTIVNGVLSVKCPSSKEVIRTVKQTQYVRDLKLESLLKEDVKLKEDSIILLSLTLRDQHVTIKELKATIVKEKAKFLVLIIALGLLIAVFVYSKFKLL